MATPATKDLRYYEGDDEDFLFRLLDKTGAPFDLTGSTVEAQVRDDVLDEAPVVRAQFAVDMTEAAVGTFVLSLTRDQTRALAGDSYMYDVQITWASSGKTRTYARGKLVGSKEVTD